MSRHKRPPGAQVRLLRVIGSFPGRVWGLQGRSIKKHRHGGSRSMGISCFSVDFGIEGWCQPTPNFSSLSDCHPNEAARKRFFFSPCLFPVYACVCVFVRARMCSARADRGHSSTCLHSFPLSQPSLHAAVLLKQIGASRLCHRMTQRPSHGVSGREAKANKTDQGDFRGRKQVRNEAGESVSAKVVTTPN